MLAIGSFAFTDTDYLQHQNAAQFELYEALAPTVTGSCPSSGVFRSFVPG